MNVVQAGRFAEAILAPDYRETLNAAFEQDAEAYESQQYAAQMLLEKTIVTNPIPEQSAWEMRRQAALTELPQSTYGPFYGYIQNQRGKSVAPENDTASIEQPVAAAMHTNNVIMSLCELTDDPNEFMSEALDAIASRRQAAGEIATNTANYATVLKFFVDKAKPIGIKNIDHDATRTGIATAVDGFVRASKREAPNYITMANMYQAVRILPADFFPQDFARTLVDISLQQLPQYHSGMRTPLLGALGSIGSAGAEREKAILIDLSLRHFGEFETTRDMFYALRAVSSLERTEDADRAFATVIELRNNLEEPLDMRGLKETNRLLAIITNNVLLDQALKDTAQDIAKKCVDIAIQLHLRAKSRGDYTDEELAEMHNDARIVVAHYSRV